MEKNPFMMYEKLCDTKKICPSIIIPVKTFLYIFRSYGETVLGHAKYMQRNLCQFVILTLCKVTSELLVVKAKG